MNLARRFEWPLFIIFYSVQAYCLQRVIGWVGLVCFIGSWQAFNYLTDLDEDGKPET